MITPAYQPLARKYRPTNFSELVGQHSTATALANAIRLGREPHAVIFSGVRGIGKTTSARLYAKALNCCEKNTGEPCSKCESCLAISAGIHEDVIEIDGASNTSVDNIRSLRETVNYVAQRSKFKVYIIDEVHMLSQSAFNALLKTLEEPPSHVIFVFATTELHKIPQTILSRCQVFYLQKISLEQIRGRLIEILNLEKIPFEEKAVTVVAREGRGSIRDSLTLLDHVIAVGNGQVSLEALSKIVTHASTTPFINLLRLMIDRNPVGIVQQLDEFDALGIDVDVIAEKTASLARHASVARDVGIEHIGFRSLGLDDSEAKLILEIGRKSAPLDINRVFRTLVKCSTELDGSPLDRYILENYCLEWCLDPGIFPTSSRSDVSTQPVATRPQSSGSAANPVLNTDAAPSLPAPKNDPKVTESRTVVLNSAPSESGFPEDWKSLVDRWKQLKPLQARKLEDAHPIIYSEQRIELHVPEGSYASTSLMKQDEQRKLKEAFAELFDFKGTLQILSKKIEAQPQLSTPQSIPESLSALNERTAIARKSQLEQEAINHPLTRETMSLFGATVESVDVHDV